MPEFAIKTTQLTRTYRKPGCGTFNAVDNLDLDVKKGEIFAFLGTNGAGKTTTMKMLLGLTFPSSGSFEIMGGKISDTSIRSKIGYLPEESGLYPFLQVKDILKFYAHLFGNTPAWRRERIDQVIDFTGLKDKSSEQVRNLSKGQRQRVGIAQALINDPELIFLDEPASGLDPMGIKDLRTMMSVLKHSGKTVFLNSHQLSEVELVADRVGMIREGKLITVGTLNELLGTDDTVQIAMSNMSPDKARKLISNIPDLSKNDWRVDGTTANLLIELDKPDFADEIITALMTADAKITSVNKSTQSLEDLFSEIMQSPPKP
ncbi:MAG: ABC transporter ATP-binding protein [bacterium]